jgi:hypothetical protein
MESAAVASAASAQILLSEPPFGQGYNQVLSLAGKDVKVTLVGQGADGARLELPSGQVITAKGQLPFPENTRLQVRVTLQDGSIRLQVLEAHPPSSAAMLAPLAQSEAGSLLQMLRDSDLPKALLPLARLFADLSPSSEQRLGQAVEALPPQTQRALAALLGVRESGPAAITRALLELFEPVKSLAELAPLFLARQAAFSPAGNKRWAMDGQGFAESLRDLFLGFLQLDRAAAPDARLQGQAESLAKSLTNELFSILKPLLGSLGEGQGGSTEKPDDPKETAQTQKQPLAVEKPAAAEENPGKAQAPKQPLEPGKGAAAGQSAGQSVSQPETQAKGQGAAAAEGDTGKAAQTARSAFDAGKAAATDRPADQGRGQGAAAVAESLGKVLQAIRSMPAAGTAAATERAAVLALLRLSVATLSGSTGGQRPEAASDQRPEDVGGDVPRDAGETGADRPTGEKTTEKAQQGYQGAKADPTAVKAADVAPNLDRPAAAPRAPESQGPPQDSGAKRDAGGKAIQMEGPKGGVVAEPVPKGAGGDDGQVRPPFTEKAFPLLRQVAEAIKGGEGGLRSGEREGVGSTAKAAVEGQAKSAGSAPRPPSEGESSGAASRSETQKPAAALESQRPAAKDEAAEPPIAGAGPQPARGLAQVQSIQDALIGRLANALAKADADTMVGAIYRYVETIQKGIQGIQDLGQEAPSGEAAKELGAARLIQVLEALPAPVKRAIASAVLGSFDADTKAIAETLVERGGAPEARQGLASKLETASPLVRQLAAVAVGLPFDAGVEKIVAAASGADKGALAAAKGVASLRDGLEPDVDKKAGIPGADRPAPSVEDRVGYLLRLEALSSQSPTPQHEKDGISSWFRSIVDLLMAAKTARQDAAPEGRADAARAAVWTTDRQAAPVPQNAAQTGDQTQTWRSWLDGCVRALADPALAKEAAFHALAAKENVNYFELPLPWTPSGSMEIWVEADGDGNQREKDGPGHRVLLGMTFSALGETRVGLESAGKRLGIRIWAERTEPIEVVLPQLRDELSALGFEPTVSLNALSVGQGGAVPSIKSALGGPGLNAVG